LNKKLAFVIYYHKHNIYSFNAIVGALETDKIIEDIDLFFLRNKEELFKGLKKIIKDYEKLVVGISFFTTQLFEINNLMKILKKNFKDKCLFVAGGPHPTGDPQGTLKIGFDIVIVGEGEETIIELMKKIVLKEKFEDVVGISYLGENGKYFYTGKRNMVNLNNYPPFPLINTKFGAIEITRGCPYVCYFCQTPYISGTQPRHRSVELITTYVKHLYNYYGDQTDIRFITPNSFSYGSHDGKELNLLKVEELLSNIRELIGKKARIYFGTFPSEVRPEHVTNKSLELILKYTNNDNITIGAQSGSQKILDICHREHSIEDIYNAVELTLKSNLKINVDFIFGLPQENEDDIKLTIEMMRNLANMGARIHTHSFIPLPQTPFATLPIDYVSTRYKKAIKNLISKGFAFGDWKKQETIAIKISQYLRKSKLE